MMKFAFVRATAFLLMFAALVLPVSAGQQKSVPAGTVVPPGYVIGPEDVLVLVFWNDDKMGREVVVRPDGRISLPLLNDIQAAGLTPEQLRVQVDAAASKFVAEPNATVVVKVINSRKIHIVGNVARPGTYPLAGDMNVLQFIALAGGLLEYADAKNLTIIRKESGRDRPLKFNFKDVSRGKNLQQNVSLQPGDTVVVP